MTNYQNMNADRIAVEYVKHLRAEDYAQAEEAFEAGIANCGVAEWRECTDTEIARNELLGY